MTAPTRNVKTNVTAMQPSGGSGRSLVSLMLHDLPPHSLVQSHTHSDAEKRLPREMPKPSPPHASGESQPEQSAGRPMLQTCTGSEQRQA